ncbi:glycoside hydrolase family 4 [Coriobacterium glomerans PW2]|uniref:Glycoside hydrolase family 4 n=1 Tax=Coriobacterium glomerans (strain ATCC 49209 / DSM 20642 / JCM 10262 / PW2) TaxID=700015 RepID=F2NAY9_CORGP|nr:6-phospho-beta-glucosidase [Coriobacterium glomerans]AEB07667.1 glycoside hydrolase family 4 [Coriobacterium glomerans PW2]
MAQENRGVKIVTIGGGSSYTPELMEGFIKRFEEMPIREIWLVDIEEGREKLEIVGAMARRMWEASGYPTQVHTTLDRRAALPDADFVTTQFRVGLLYARIKDERIPLSWGMLGQETNGAGGIFKAFRTIPVIGEIIDDMRELCPEAWLVNFTNPSGMVTEAAIKQFGWRRTIGLCNVPVNAMLMEPKIVGYPEGAEDLTFRFAGLNHFHWHRVFDRRGADITARVIERLNDPDNGMPVNIADIPFPLDLIRAIGMLPCAYHRYYYLHAEMLAHALEEFARGESRAEQVKKTEEELFELYRDPALDHKPEQLARRGGAHYSDAACECVNAIWNDKHEHMVVSCENRGALSDLASDSIVEVSALISSKGAEPIAWGEMPAQERGWLQMMKAMEECVIDAAITGDYGRALEAFCLNPLIENGAAAQHVLDELLIAHERYLPRFAAKIVELKSAGVQVRDETAARLVAQGH